MCVRVLCVCEWSVKCVLCGVCGCGLVCGVYVSVWSVMCVLCGVCWCGLVCGVCVLCV